MNNKKICVAASLALLLLTMIIPAALAGVEVANVNFAASGLPAGTSITVSWSKTNPAGNPATGTTTFSAPGPSGNEGTKPATTFSYTFPATVTVGSDTYDLVSSSPASGFATGADKSTTTVTATYSKENVEPLDTTPPAITAPADLTIEGNTIGGALISASDIGTATAVDNVDPSPTITNDFIAGFHPLGDFTVTWTATDASGNSASAIQTISVVDTTPPTITAPATLSVIVNAPKSLLSGSATDIVDASPTLTNDAPAVFSPGQTTVTWTATDASGNAAHATTVVTATYVFSGFMPPLQDGGTCKAGSTIPVKFQLTDYNGNFVTNLGAVLSISPTSPTGGTALRYDMTANQYVYNLSTKGMSTGPLTISVTLSDGTTKTASVVLK